MEKKDSVKENKSINSILYGVKLLFFCVLASCNSYGQSYKKISPQYLSTLQVSQAQRDSVRNIVLDPYNLVNALPKGYVKDASKDYTSEIQWAIKNYRNVIFPNFPILINENGLSVYSNSNLFFDKNSKLVLKSNNLSHYEILRIHDVNNVNVYFANIEGDKLSHTENVGEWGMGISIRGTNNITLYASSVKECWGDGIYLGISPSTSNVNNKNVKIIKALIDNNRRNGMSIISAENLTVSKIIVSNTFGTPPMAGIDIEPDSNTDIIKNLYFTDIISYNNTNHGFLFVLGNLYGKQSDIGKIRLNNFKAIYGDLGISFKIGPEKEMNFKPVGNIEINHAKFENLNRQEFLSYEENGRNNIQVNIRMNDNKNLNRYNSFFYNSKKITITK